MGKLNPLTHELRKLGLMGLGCSDKHVPQQYLLADIEQRLALLQGLCDTDGSVSRGLGVDFISSSKQLAEDTAFLARSLGGVCSIHPTTKYYTYLGKRLQGAPCWRLHFSLPLGLNPFRLSRKASKITESKWTYDQTKAIRKIALIGRAPAQCIQIAHPEQLYITDDFTVTHNTTALRLLRGQFPPDSGVIKMGGLPIQRLDQRAYRRKLGFVSQGMDTLPRYSVEENIALPLQYLRLDPPYIRTRVNELLEVFGLQHARHRLCDDQELSGGERQRLAIARAIAHGPDLLLCDEPTGNLDSRTTLGVMRTLNRVSMIGTTVICVTHDPAVVNLMQKRVIVVHDGRVVSDSIGGYRLG